MQNIKSQFTDSELEIIMRLTHMMLSRRLDKNSAIYCLVEAVKYCNSRGAFTLGEAELLAKSIRTLSKTESKEENGTSDAAC